MRMFRARVDLELSGHLFAQRIFRQHALNGLGQHVRRVFLMKMFCRNRFQSSGVTGMVCISFCAHLVAAQVNLLGIDDDDMIAGIDVRREGRLVFAPQHDCHAGRQASKRFAIGIHDIPFANHFCRFG